MILHSTDAGPLFVRMPLLRLEPTPLEELRDAGKNVVFALAWSLVRLGLALSRRFEPCDVCPRCGPYPCIGHDGKCAECGSETFNSEETEDFGA